MTSVYSLRVQHTPALAPPDRYIGDNGKATDPKTLYRWINIANFVRGESMVEGRAKFGDPGAWVDIRHAYKMVRWYESLQVDPTDRLPTSAVDYSLAASTWRQLGNVSLHHANGLRSYMHFSLVEAPPYASDKEMFTHIDTGFLLVQSSRSLGGHPLWTDSQWEAFRMTHDVCRWLWHHPNVLPGQDGAYRTHAAMVGDIIRPALAMETRVRAAAETFGLWTGHKLVLPDPWVYRTNGPIPIES